MSDNIDPRTVLFSIPTITRDLAETVAAERPPVESDVVFHEDDWRQIEFYPRNYLADVQEIMNELHDFEQKHRKEGGWDEIYLRAPKPLVLLKGDDTANRLCRMLDIVDGKYGDLYLYASDTVNRVVNGFSLAVGGDIALYGVRTDEGVSALGAVVGEKPDHTILTTAFQKINRSEAAVLVDWRAQMILLDTTRNGQIRIWRP